MTFRGVFSHKKSTAGDCISSSESIVVALEEVEGEVQSIQWGGAVARFDHELHCLLQCIELLERSLFLFYFVDSFPFLPLAVAQIRVMKFKN